MEKYLHTLKFLLSLWSNQFRRQENWTSVNPERWVINNSLNWERGEEVSKHQKSIIPFSFSCVCGGEVGLSM